MHNLSMMQALSLWSQLERAYYGKNSFGGDTAEVYMYQCMAHEPAVARSNATVDSEGLFGDLVREAYDKANESLHNILQHFAKARNAQIEVDGKELGAWLKTARFTHRVHVRVIDPEARKQWDPHFLTTIEEPMPVGNLHALLSKEIEAAGLDPLTPVKFKVEGHEIQALAMVEDDD